MLLNEYRRLKSEDIAKLRDRQKRIEQRKKMDLLHKDLTQTHFLKSLRDGQ